MVALLAVFGPEGVMRVLRPDGLLVVNYGDKYVAGGGAGWGRDRLRCWCRNYINPIKHCSVCDWKGIYS